MGTSSRQSAQQTGGGMRCSILEDCVLCRTTKKKKSTFEQNTDHRREWEGASGLKGTTGGCLVQLPATEGPSRAGYA